MDKLQRFISEQNISRFADQLRRESNAVRRDTLKRLLIEEEDRFGANVEWLHMIERYIAVWTAEIVRQTGVVSELKSNGDDANDAESILQTYVKIKDLFTSYRARISQTVEL
jgi:hypothetical protein